nr:l-rhamnose-1-dehydrogenase [Quercus suber]
MALLKGKVAAITGAATGIGRAIALDYLRHGARVAINHYPDPQSGKQFRDMLDEAGPEATDLLIAVPGDISDPETGKQLFDVNTSPVNSEDSTTGLIDIAKLTYSHARMTPDLVNRTIATNLNGAFFAVQAAAQQMAKQTPSGGSIIGISSISALVGGAGQTHYTPTKAGVLSLMQSTACALGKYGIRCNALLPGTIRTQLNDEDLESEEKRSYMEGRIPLGRLGKTQDLAGPAVFLASDMSEYVTGAQLLVDGGLFVNLQ